MIPWPAHGTKVVVEPPEPSRHPGAGDCGGGEAKSCVGWVSSLNRPLGWMLHRDDVDTQDMDGFTHEDFLQLMEVDREAWRREAILDEELTLKLDGKLPKEFLLDRELHISRLWRSPETWKLAYQGASDVARSSGAKTVVRLARDPLRVGSPSRYGQIGLMRRSERSFEAGTHHPTTDLKGDQSRRCRDR